MSDKGERPAASYVNPQGPGVWRQHLLAAGIILLAVVAGYVPPLRGGQVYYSQDTSDLNYVMLRSHLTDLREHGWVSWCRGVGGGHYRAANPTYGLFSLRALVFLLVPGYAAQTAAILLYAFWAGLGAYFLGRNLAGSWTAGLYLGVAWPLCGVVAGMTGNIPYLASAAWLGWVFAAWFGIAGGLARAARSAFGLALMAGEGDPFGAGITLAVLGFISLIAPVSGSRKQEGLVLAGAAALLIALSAIVWMPALAFLPESSRAGGLSISEATTFSMHPLEAIHLIAPGFFGQIYNGSFWANDLTSSVQEHAFWFQSVYLGLLTPALLLAALMKAHPGQKRAAAMTAIALLLAVLACGRNTPVTPWLLEHFSALRAFRYPAKLFAWSALLLLAAAAMGFSRVSEWLGEDPTRRRAAVVLFLLYAAGLTLILVLAADAVAEIKRVSDRPEQSLRYQKEDLVRLALFTAGLPLLILFADRRKTRLAKTMPYILIGITGLDLLSSLPTRWMNPGLDLDRPSPTAREILRRGHGRLITEDQIYYQLSAVPRTSLMPEWGILDGLDYAFGKTASLPGRLDNLYSDRLAEHPRQLFRVLAARWVLAPMNPLPKWIAQLAGRGVITLAFTRTEDRIAVYQTAETYPEFFLTRKIEWTGARDQALTKAEQNPDPDSGPVFLAADAAICDGKLTAPAPLVLGPPADRATMDPDEQVLIRQIPDGDHETFTVALQAPAWLILREYLEPGWRVKVNAQEQCIYFADGIGRAVRLPAGKNEISFVFAPREIKYGFLLSGTTLFFLAALALRPKPKKNPRKNP